jgi:hypothetical protein
MGIMAILFHLRLLVATNETPVEAQGMSADMIGGSLGTDGGPGRNVTTAGHGLKTSCPSRGRPFRVFWQVLAPLLLVSLLPPTYSYVPPSVQVLLLQLPPTSAKLIPPSCLRSPGLSGAAVVTGATTSTCL